MESIADTHILVFVLQTQSGALQDRMFVLVDKNIVKYSVNKIICDQIIRALFKNNRITEQHFLDHFSKFI